MIDLLTAIAMLLGSLFCLLGAVGMIRMPDMLTRMQAATKTGTLGVGLIAVAYALNAPAAESITQAILIIAFLALTAPIAAHLIARNAYHAGVRPWSRSVRDDLATRTGRSDSSRP